jgi:signal transduction histidine kinase
VIDRRMRPTLKAVFRSTIDRIGALAPCVLCLCLLWACCAQSRAQSTLNSAMVERGPFSDPAMDGMLRRILQHMDAFHADSSMHWIAKGLQHIGAREALEERYFLLSYRAEVLYYEGLFTEGMQDLEKCMRIAEELEDSLLIANIHNLRGLLHENIQESREALPHMRLALQWFPRNGSARYPVSELYHIHGNLGSYLMNSGHTDSAGHHLVKSLQLAQAVNAGRATAVAWWSLGKLALRQQFPDSALRCFERCIAKAEEHADHDIRLDGYAGLASALVTQGREREAQAVLARAAQHSKEHPNGIGLVTQRNFARERSKVLRDMGDHAGALLAIGEWHHMDSAITAGNTQAALRIQSELLRSDASLELARVEQERTAEDLAQMRTSRALVAATSLLAILVVLGTYLTYRSRQRSRQRLAELELMRLQQERTIAELRIREEVGRDMHDDLGAGLSALKLRSEMALRVEVDPKKREFLGSMATSAGELIGSMRQIIWAMNNDQGSLADLVAYINGYAGNYLADHALEAEINEPGPLPSMELTSEQRRNLFLVVKECLHNVVKHAKATRVTIGIHYRKGMLEMHIADNGIGLSAAAGAHGGNGMRNIRLRIERLGGTVRITSDGGTRISCSVPLPTPNERSIAALRHNAEFRTDGTA